MSDIPLKGRFAPSPSGRMHLGNVFSALISWLSVRASGGDMLLRIEDLDTQRCRPEYTDQLLDDLRYLGLDYDEGEGVGGENGPYRQSLRTSFYEEVLCRLEEQGVIYPCYCSRDELHAASAPHASDGRVIYGGTCRGLSTEARAAKTRPPAYRVIAEDRDAVFTDGLYGLQRMNTKAEWGDFVVRRSDGMFSYQLAVTADDAAMGVTQVVRGRDLLTSVAPQLQLYRLYGVRPPTFYHIPLLVSSDGRRLSKRDRDLDLGVLRERFPSAEPLIGHLLFLAGLLPKAEPLSAREAVEVFSWDKMRRTDITVDGPLR